MDHNDPMVKNKQPLGVLILTGYREPIPLDFAKEDTPKE
jgi:hypothetical protein